MTGGIFSHEACKSRGSLNGRFASLQRQSKSINFVESLVIMNTIELKTNLHNLIDNINDNKILHAVYILLTKKEEETDFWDELPEHLKEAINKSLSQSEKGEVKPNEEIMKKYQKWL